MAHCLRGIIVLVRDTVYTHRLSRPDCVFPAITDLHTIRWGLWQTHCHTGYVGLCALMCTFRAHNPCQRLGYATLTVGIVADFSVTIAFLLVLRKSYSLAHSQCVWNSFQANQCSSQISRGTKGVVQNLMRYALSSCLLTG